MVTLPTFHWPQQATRSNTTPTLLVGATVKSQGKGGGYKATKIRANKSMHQNI